MIRQYVTDYNNRLKFLAERTPERMLLLRTEDLSEPSTRREISAFLGFHITEVPIHLNVGRMESNAEGGFWF
jgi:hypothetical protein